MTESQKYEAKNSAAAMGSGMSKGDAKQEAWLNKINQAVADSASQSDKRVTKVLEKLPDYPNIPRKRAKLINFLKSSLRVNDPQVCEAVWDFLEKATVPAPAAEITTAAVGEEKAKEEEVKREETEEKAQGGGEMDIDKDVATTNGAGAGEGEKKKKKKKKDKSAEAGEEKKTTAVENGAETPLKEKNEGKKEGKKKKKENKKVETAGAGEAEAKPTEETKKISETKEEDTPTSIEAEEEEQKSDEREEKIGKAKKRKMSENATETEEAGKKKKKKGKVNGTAEVKEGETAVVTHTIVESSGVTVIDGEGKRKKKKGKKNQGESQDDTVVIHSFVVMDTDATIPAVADLTMDAKVDDKSVAEKVKTPEVSNPTDSGTKKQKKKKKKTMEEKESGSDKENAPSPKEEKKGKKKKGKTGNVTNGVEKGKNNETAVVDKSADLPVPTTKEDVKLVKKLKRKKRREEELAAGITKVKKEKEVKEGESVPDKPDAGKAGKKKGKSKDAVKPDQGESASPTKNKKGKRFDIGRVIHSFLDACPTKKASFTEVTAKVLEEFKRVKFQPDMEEKNLMNKINKKIELNPNINIKNGEIILV